MSRHAQLPPTYLEALADGFSTEHARKVAACTAGFGQSTHTTGNGYDISDLQLTYITVALGGFSGSAIAAIKYAPAIPAAFHSALSTGAPAFAYFSGLINSPWSEWMLMSFSRYSGVFDVADVYIPSCTRKSTSRYIASPSQHA